MSRHAVSVGSPAGAGWLFALAVALAPASALAGLHQICYQDPSQNGTLTAVFECRSDDPAISCTIAAPHLSYVWIQTGPGFEKRKVTLPMSATYTGSVTFTSGATRSCTVEVLDPALGLGGGPASAGSVLVGFTTDESGRLSTGVWRLRSNVNQRRVGQTLKVPGDFVAVSGGVVGAELPYGALVYKSAPTRDAELRGWSVGTQDAAYAQPHDNDAYAVGLKIEGLDVHTLRSLVAFQEVGSGSTWVASPSATATEAGGTVLLGGGLDAFGYGTGFFGQYATTTRPVWSWKFCLWYAHCSPYAWTATSKDHLISSPGWVVSKLVALPAQISIGGVTYWVVTDVRTARSPAAVPHPTATVAGSPGEYALAGIGAWVDWQPYGWAGNLLWKLQPRPDIAGAEVGSKDHGIASPAVITAYLVGVKLTAYDPNGMVP